jgi:uncharacterized membrane protein
MELNSVKSSERGYQKAVRSSVSSLVVIYFVVMLALFNLFIIYTSDDSVAVYDSTAVSRGMEFGCRHGCFQI